MSRDRIETGWEGLRLVVELLDGYYQAFVYDPRKFEVLHTLPGRISMPKLAAVEYAICHRFGLQVI
jgi:hypothetical protein